MKRTKTFFLALLCTVLYALPVAADVAKTVKLTTAGTLSTALTDDEKSSITHLTITGEINKLDFNVMKSGMESLTYIDLSGSTIAYYSSSYPANTIPYEALGDSWGSSYANTKISTFIFPSGVTSIDDRAFEYCSGLTGSLTIPEGVTSISNYAFRYCSGLTGSLTIPEGVTSIGFSAFQYCSGFNGSLTIQEGVTSIGDNAFYGCSGFTGSLTIPEGVTSISYAAFQSCSGFNGSLTIPEGVTSIGSYAFQSCSGFTGSLTIPEGVTEIGSSAFSSCSGFTGSLTIPEGVTSISYSAFSGCSGFTGSLTIPEGVTSISYYAFSGCRCIDNIIVENTTPCTLRSGAFPSNKIIFVPSGSLTSYKADDTWSSYMLLEEDVEATIHLDTPNTLALSVVTAGYHPTTITKLTLSGEVGDDDWALLKSNFTSLYYLDMSGTTATAIPEEAFKSNTLMQTYIFPEDTETIGSSAFYGCTGLLGSLIIPEGVTSIGSSAFRDCSGFTGSLTILEGVTSIGSSAFAYCSGFNGSLTILEGVTSIGDSAFYDCSGFTGSLTILEGVTSIGSSAFRDCSGFTGSLTIPEGVTSIGGSAFYGCSGFTGSLTILEGVTLISNLAFADCSGFTGSLTIPEGVNSIGGSAFYGCSGFTGSLTIPEGVTSIGDWAFRSCSGFTGSLTIPKGVTSISGAAFYDCSGFTGSLTIPEGVTSIGSSAFSSCSGFTGSLTIPEGVTSIGSYAFSSCSGFTSLIFEDGVTSVPAVFSGCTGITTLTSYSATPPTCSSGCFDSIDKDNCTLEVPTNALIDYLMAAEWGTFINMTGVEVPITMYTAKLTVGDNGTITANETNYTSGSASVEVAEGEDFIFTVTPNDNYTITSVLLDGVDITDQLVDNQYTVSNVQANFTLAVTFEELPTVYLANLTVGDNGTVTANETNYTSGSASIEVTEGEDFTFTVTPNNNCVIASVLLDGVDITNLLVDNQYTVSNVQANLTLAVTFEVLPTYITLSVWEQGAVRQQVTEGSTICLQLIPAEDWTINSVSYNGVDVTDELDEENFYTTPAIANGDALVVTYLDNSASVATTSIDPDIRVYASSTNQIAVVGAESGEQIAIYTIAGKTVAQRVATDNIDYLDVTANAVYIVRVGGYTFKLAL